MTILHSFSNQTLQQNVDKKLHINAYKALNLKTGIYIHSNSWQSSKICWPALVILHCCNNFGSYFFLLCFYFQLLLSWAFLFKFLSSSSRLFPVLLLFGLPTYSYLLPCIQWPLAWSRHGILVSSLWFHRPTADSCGW